jgi:hypothetical protein
MEVKIRLKHVYILTNNLIVFLKGATITRDRKKLFQYPDNNCLGLAGREDNVMQKSRVYYHQPVPISDQHPGQLSSNNVWCRLHRTIILRSRRCIVRLSAGAEVILYSVASNSLLISRSLFR